MSQEPIIFKSAVRPLVIGPRVCHNTEEVEADVSTTMHAHTNRGMAAMVWGAILRMALAGSPCAFSTPAPVVNHGDIWYFHKGTNAPQIDWKTAGDVALGAGWAAGEGGFGYADNTNETANCRTLLADMSNRYTTVYMRRVFAGTNAVAPDLHLFLRMDWDDGYIAWLDGIYLTSANVTGAPAEPGNSAVAGASHESSRGNNSPAPAVATDLGPADAWVTPGPHVLAVMGLNQTAKSSDCVVVPDLFLDVPPAQVTNVWSAASSPIIVSTNVIVSPNATLIIEPGVTVAFESGVGLTVDNGGHLLAEGTAESPILFTRAGTNANWDHVTVNGTAGSAETRIAHARFEFNATNAGVPCIHVAAGTVHFDHLAFGNTAAPYIHLDGASFVVSDCVFPTETAGFELVHGAAGIKSGGRGIFLRNFFGGAQGYNDAVDFTGGQRPGPIVQFIHNVFTSASDDILDLDNTDAWIEGNIFLHAHKNGTPDTSSAVSGGNDTGTPSDITIIGNIIYDCDHAGLAKQGNFYTFLNNTIVRQTHEGGLDTTGAVVCLEDGGATEGRGAYLEGNIIFDAEALTQNVTDAIVTFTNNLMALPWTGPGGGNSAADPLFAHVPQVSETVFTNWREAQIMRDWFSLLPGSPAIGAGPNGSDLGGVIPLGVSVGGEPAGATSRTSAILTVGINRAGDGIPVSGWPEGSGYTRYRWRLDGGAWSGETPIGTPILLSGLADGPHSVDVSGLRDSGFYQDDPVFGPDAVVTHSRTWTVRAPSAVRVQSLGLDVGDFRLRFEAEAGQAYSVWWNDSLLLTNWAWLSDLPGKATGAVVEVSDPSAASATTRFYRIAGPVPP